MLRVACIALAWLSACSARALLEPNVDLAMPDASIVALVPAACDQQIHVATGAFTRAHVALPPNGHTDLCLTFDLGDQPILALSADTATESATTPSFSLAIIAPDGSTLASGYGLNDPLTATTWARLSSVVKSGSTGAVLRVTSNREVDVATVVTLQLGPIPL
jgi:hypothetical protein